MNTATGASRVIMTYLLALAFFQQQTLAFHWFDGTLTTFCCQTCAQKTKRPTWRCVHFFFQKSKRQIKQPTIFIEISSADQLKVADCFQISPPRRPFFVFHTLVLDSFKYQFSVCSSKVCHKTIDRTPRSTWYQRVPTPPSTGQHRRISPTQVGGPPALFFRTNVL